MPGEQIGAAKLAVAGHGIGERVRNRRDALGYDGVGNGKEGALRRRADRDRAEQSCAKECTHLANG